MSILQRAVPMADLRATIRLALPLIAGQLAIFGQHLIDVMLAGHLGTQVLGAVAVGTNIWSLPVMATVGMMMAMPPSVAQLDGAGRRGETAALFRQSVWLAIMLGAVLQQVAWWGGPMLAGMIGLEPALVAEVVAFLRPISFEAPALGLFCACRGLTDGLGWPRVSLGFGMLGLVLLLPVAWMLMYGKFGLPALGAQGSGLATALVVWVQALAYLAYVRFSPRTRALGWGRGHRGPDWLVIGALLHLGVPMSISVLLEVGLFSAVALVIGGFGAAAIGAHQIALSVAGATFMVPLGLSMAITVRVGNAVGRGDPRGVRRAGLVGIGLAGITQSLACLLMLLMPRNIASLYTADPALLDGAVALLFLAALFQLSDGIQVASAGALRGLKDTRMPMVITLVAYWGAGMPLGWLLCFTTGLGVRGMWMGLVAGLSCAAVL
ncbi:MAG TPA: MATE family efflux transporter, partial [Acetobacteraceae bacterium]